MSFHTCITTAYRRESSLNNRISFPANSSHLTFILYKLSLPGLWACQFIDDQPLPLNLSYLSSAWIIWRHLDKTGGWLILFYLSTLEQSLLAYFLYWCMYGGRQLPISICGVSLSFSKHTYVLWILTDNQGGFDTYPPFFLKNWNTYRRSLGEKTIRPRCKTQVNML